MQKKGEQGSTLVQVVQCKYTLSVGCAGLNSNTETQRK